MFSGNGDGEKDASVRGDEIGERGKGENDVISREGKG